MFHAEQVAGTIVVVLLGVVLKGFGIGSWWSLVVKVGFVELILIGLNILPHANLFAAGGFG